MRNEDYFISSQGIVKVSSTERLRQRLDEAADSYREVAEKCSVRMLKIPGHT